LHIVDVTRHQHGGRALGAGEVADASDCFQPFVAQRLGGFVRETERLADLPIGRVDESHAAKVALGGSDSQCAGQALRRGGAQRHRRGAGPSGIAMVGLFPQRRIHLRAEPVTGMAT
jgi:hypothetical protein